MRSYRSLGMKVFEIEDFRIPVEPRVEQIIQLLAVLPNQIAQESIKLISLRREIDEKKLLLKGEVKNLELHQAAVRKYITRQYKNALKEFVYHGFEAQVLNIRGANELLTEKEIRDLAKQLRPDKPTRLDLDDVSITEKNTKFKNEIIHKKEEELVLLQEEFEIQRIVVVYLENNLRAVTSIKGLIQNEL